MGDGDFKVKWILLSGLFILLIAIPFSSSSIEVLYNNYDTPSVQISAAAVVSGGGSGTGGGKAGGFPWLFNNSLTMFFNGTKLNDTINQLATGGNGSWNQTLASTLYSPIKWAYNQSDGSYNATYDKWAYNMSDGSGGAGFWSTNGTTIENKTVSHVYIHANESYSVKAGRLNIFSDSYGNSPHIKLFRNSTSGATMYSDIDSNLVLESHQGLVYYYGQKAGGMGLFMRQPINTQLMRFYHGGASGTGSLFSYVRNFGIINIPNGYHLYLNSENKQTMRLDHNQNVQFAQEVTIGRDNVNFPHKLSVVGDANISTDLNVGDDITVADNIHGQLDWVYNDGNDYYNCTVWCDNMDNIITGFSYTCVDAVGGDGTEDYDCSEEGSGPIICGCEQD